MEFGYVDWNSFIWGIVITVGIIQGYRHRHKIFDLEDDQKDTKQNHSGNHQYEKGA